MHGAIACILTLYGMCCHEYEACHEVLIVRMLQKRCKGKVRLRDLDCGICNGCQLCPSSPPITVHAACCTFLATQSVSSDLSTPSSAQMHNWLLRRVCAHVTRTVLLCRVRDIQYYKLEHGSESVDRDNVADSTAIKHPLQLAHALHCSPPLRQLMRVDQALA